MKYIFTFVLAILFSGVASAQTTLSYLYQVDTTGYSQQNWQKKYASNKYSRSYLGRCGNDLVFIIESTRYVSYAYAMYSTSNEYTDSNLEWYQSGEKNAYRKYFDVAKNKWILEVKIGDYREIQPVQDHYVMRVNVLLQYEDQPKDYNIMYVFGK